MSRYAAPLIHFTLANAPGMGWHNDIHGFRFHNGEYHAFFQYVPGNGRTKQWEHNIRWGHATSRDLKTWTFRGVALEPDNADEGCWSGCLVSTPDGYRIYYTSVSRGNQHFGRARVARPSGDDWNQPWMKDPESLHLVVPDDVTDFRDFYVFQEGNAWRMIVGAGLRSGRGAIIGYRSRDCENWGPPEYFVGGPGNRTIDGALVFECSQLIHVEGRPVAVVSAMSGEFKGEPFYSIGEYDATGRFLPGEWRPLSKGAYYATSLATFADDSVGLVHWVQGAGADSTEVGWAGAMSVPQVATIEDDRLVLRPHPMVLPPAPTSERPAAWNGGRQHVMTSNDAACAVTLRNATGYLSLSVTAAGDNTELAQLTLEGNQLTLTSRGHVESVTIEPGDDIQVIVDRGIIEVFPGRGPLLAGVFDPLDQGLTLHLDGTPGLTSALVTTLELSPTPQLQL